MRSSQPEAADVGVIVGRFQIHDLHDGHRDLIQHVVDNHANVIVLLGLSPLPNTTRNPLDFHARKNMILRDFPDVTVLYVKDCPSDIVWSQKVDEVIGDATATNQSVRLYGGRDSFVSYYTGRYDTEVLESDLYLSATEARRRLRVSVDPNSDFRAGMVYAAMNRFPVSYTTVDVAVFSEGGGKLLLARKPGEVRYRLIGGFVDPSDASFEAAARREVHEEAGIEITDPLYRGSKIVDDWRYRAEVDKIKTAVFTATIVFGTPTPADDIVEVRWFDVNELKIEHIVREHLPLMPLIFQHWHTLGGATS